MRKILFADSHYFDEHLRLGQMHYALEFAEQDWKTAYIANPLSPFNTLLGQNRSSSIRRLKNHIQTGSTIKKNLWYYVPFTLIPFHNRTIFDRKWFIDNYHRFTFPSIKTVIKTKGFSAVDVLWIGTVNQKYWQEILDYKFCIFRLSDNTREFRKSGKVLSDSQEQVILASDCILVTSLVLLEEYRQKYSHKKFVYFPNGVNLSNFIRDKYIRPDEYSGIDDRIALYIGAIGDWFDHELLITVARQCPDISFFIIGVDDNGKMSKISARNIHYLGPRSYEQIPDYIYYSDCGIIPFDDSLLVQSISPLKMYEFFSLGKPVISKSWRELRLIKSPCFLAEDARQFVDFLKDDHTFAVNSDYLKEYARQNTWHNRYLKVIDILHENSII